MKIVAVALAMGIATPVAAAEPQSPQLQLRPKAALTLVPSHNAAPFVVQPVGEPEIELVPRHPMRLNGHPMRLNESHSACDGTNALCYDPSSGRNFMPDLPGLRRETISIKRDRILFRYTF